MDELTEAQKRVMSWIGKGWHARRSHGSVIEVNGKRLCNANAMMALYCKEFAQQAAADAWTAPDTGKNLVAQLGLSPWEKYLQCTTVTLSP